MGSLYLWMVEWSIFHHSPGGLAALVDLLGSEAEDGPAASTGGEGEREATGGALAFLLGILTGKGEAEGEGEGLGSVAGRIFGAGGDGEGALWMPLSSTGSAFTSGPGLGEGDGICG